MNMTSDYEEPTSIQSGYGSMRHSSHSGKITYVRRTPKYTYARSIRGSRDISSKSNGLTIYFAFIVVICALNMAATCYLIVSNETRSCSHTQPSNPSTTDHPANVAESLEQLKSNINTMMTALTYTLPQVLHNNKIALQTRLNFLATDIKDTLRRGYMNLDVKFGLNRTVVLKTGQAASQETTAVADGGVTTGSSGKDSGLVTLVPRIEHPRTRDLPFTKVDQDSEVDRKVGFTPFYQRGVSHSMEGRTEDIAVLNPVI
ncbi:transmembrane protein [Rodent paramyxovirus]|uniref:Transmembrane protein n=1 Tax=Rodent paramyxovirus TaxID=1497434 RepID=A0AAD0ACP5_9MONO|nr:transmembrane protein [Rodent paramyxovirus]ATP66851.1 transmembrane protein [Rodent paramyxovirus]